MKTIYKISRIAAISALFLSFGIAQAQELIPIVKKEVERNKQELKIDKLQRPFYIRYIIIDNKSLNLSASLGSIVNSGDYTDRYGMPTLLVGNYEQNNLNYIDPNIYYRVNSYPQRLSLENDEANISNTIWSALDKQYKTAAEVYETKHGIKSQQQKLEDDKVADYTSNTPVKMKIDPTSVKYDKAYWEDYIKKGSAVFAKYPDIIRSGINFTLSDLILNYYDTEGSEYSIPSPYYKVHITAGALCSDGQEINEDQYYEYSTFDRMPTMDEFLKNCDEFAKHITQLKNAPLIDEAYSGPVLIEQMALAETFHANFFNSSLIAKQKPITSEDMRYYNQSASQGNNMEMMTNKKIISRDLTVTSLSGSPEYKGVKLDGYIPVDAEAVVPEKELLLVENGVLRNMLNGRIPTKYNKKSNGHSRINFHQRSAIVAPGNVRLSSRNTFADAELKKKLIAAAKEEDLDYAYIVRRMRGNTPLAMYKIYVANGHEELVRGASLPDLTLKSFKRVLGASNKDFIYNVYSFGCFTTYIVPEALLFEELDVARDNNITFKTPYAVPQPMR